MILKADEFFEFTESNPFLINEKKCEVITFNFSKKFAFPPDIRVGKSDILTESTHATVLGLIIEENLKWNKNTEFIFKKAASKLWLLRRLKQFDLEPEILTDFYLKEVRVHLEYGVPVWYSAITRQQSNSLEKIQRWAVSIILNNWTVSYRVKCTLLSIEPLFFRRKTIALNFALRSAKNPRHSDLFTKTKNVYNTRNSYKLYEESTARTQRCYKSPLMALTRDLNQHIIKNS